MALKPSAPGDLHLTTTSLAAPAFPGASPGADNAAFIEGQSRVGPMDHIALASEIRALDRHVHIVTWSPRRERLTLHMTAVFAEDLARARVTVASRCVGPRALNMLCYAMPFTRRRQNPA